MFINIAATTHVGLERDNNEDTLIVCPDLSHPDWTSDHTSLSSLPLSPQGALLAVADGVGGNNAGEVASAIAMQTLAKTLTPEATAQAAHTDDLAAQLLHQAVQDAHDAINQHIIEDFHTLGMSTTIVLAWVTPHRTHIAWCGDSRCYAYTPTDGLRQLTHDHSYVQQLIDSGTLTPEEAFTHPDSNVITHAIGDVDCSSLADTTSIPTTPDTTLILCSDGLCGYNTDQAIARIVARHHTSPSRCCHALLQLALDAGGQDNIAITVAHLTPQPSPQTPNSSLLNTRAGRFITHLLSLLTHRQ